MKVSVFQIRYQKGSTVEHGFSEYRLMERLINGILINRGDDFFSERSVDQDTKMKEILTFLFKRCCSCLIILFK